jgi:hypothetical protein
MNTKTILAALALTVAAPTLAHAIPPCRVSPNTICTIDGPADQRRIPMPVIDPDKPRVARPSDPLPMNLPPARTIVVAPRAAPSYYSYRSTTRIYTPPPIYGGYGRRGVRPSFAPDYHGWAGGRRR